MAGLTQRIFIASGIIGLAGAYIFSLGTASAKGKDQAFLERISPKEVAGLKFTPDDEKQPGISYQVSKDVLDTLRPFGVVPRVYGDADEAYEVLLISSNTTDSFHDPRVCFPAQGNTPIGDEYHTVETDRGPIEILVSKYANISGGLMTANLYKGPHGKYYTRPQALKMGMMMEALKAGTNLDSNFYRFMPRHRNPDVKKLLAFVKAYLDAAAKTSNGYL